MNRKKDADAAVDDDPPKKLDRLNNSLKAATYLVLEAFEAENPDDLPDVIGEILRQMWEKASIAARS